MKRLLLTLMMLLMASQPVFAVAPTQANPNNLLFQGVDDTTGNAAAPYVSHGGGSVYVQPVSASGVSAPTTASGVPYVVTESIKPTYRAAASDVAPAATATDIATLCGSASSVVRVDRIEITADSTAAASMNFYIYKTSTANTGGATSAVAAVPMDSADPVATATVVKYTANPTLGTRGLIISNLYALPGAASSGLPIVPWAEDFSTRNDKALVLRGTGECAAVNLNGQVIPAGMTVHVGFTWTEE